MNGCSRTIEHCLACTETNLLEINVTSKTSKNSYPNLFREKMGYYTTLNTRLWSWCKKKITTEVSSSSTTATTLSTTTIACR